MQLAISQSVRSQSLQNLVDQVGGAQFLLIHSAAQRSLARCARPVGACPSKLPQTSKTRFTSRSALFAFRPPG